MRHVDAINTSHSKDEISDHHSWTSFHLIHGSGGFMLLLSPSSCGPACGVVAVCSVGEESGILAHRLLRCYETRTVRLESVPATPLVSSRWKQCSCLQGGKLQVRVRVATWRTGNTWQRVKPTARVRVRSRRPNTPCREPSRSALTMSEQAAASVITAQTAEQR